MSAPGCGVQPKAPCPRCGRLSVWYLPVCKKCGYDIFHGKEDADDHEGAMVDRPRMRNDALGSNGHARASKEIAGNHQSRERLDRVRRERGVDLAERLLLIGRDCAVHLKEPFRTIKHGNILYDDHGLPK